MAELIDLRDLYTSIAGSMDDANRHMEEAAKDSEFSYAITELDFSIPFNELVFEEKRIGISLTKEGEPASEGRNLSFKVRFVPRTSVQPVTEEELEKPKAVVPDILNTPLDEAKAQLKAWGLDVGNIRYDARRKPAGQVVSQIPLPMTRAKPGDKVDLVVAGSAPKPRPRRKATPKETTKESSEKKPSDE